MRILGIDPGSRITGYGVVEAQGSQLFHVSSGRIRVPDENIGIRLRTIYQQIEQIIESNNPEAVAVEKVFVARNARSALMLGQARGAVIVAAGSRELDIEEYSPLEIKQAVVGRGRAAKQQVQHMVKVLLNLASTPETDTADALACAICHINYSRSRNRYTLAAGALN